MWALLKGGRIIDPVSGFNDVGDILVRDGIIADVGSIGPVANDYQVFDLTGKVACPGLIDMHVHLREPGYENKETIETGAKAAAAGGFTTVVCMPNTNPVLDNRPQLEYVRNRSREAGAAHVIAAGALTKNLSGQEMAELGEMAEAGAAAFTDDAFPIQNSRLMRLCMSYAKMLDKPVLTHCEDKSLSGDGLVNEGIVATIAGLRGIPAASEEIMVSRNIMLAALSGCRLHIQHVSTAGSVEIIRRAKKDGILVTAETCPQYFTLTDEAVASFDTNTKMNPPLRSAKDVQAIKDGLADGTIDVIATDHAPHASEDKEVEYDAAAFGIVGLETALGLVITELVEPGFLTLAKAIEKMTIKPASALNLPFGSLKKGCKADITIIDPDFQWTVRSGEFKSKGRNMPFEGRKLTGKAVAAIVGGEIVHRTKEFDTVKATNAAK